MLTLTHRVALNHFSKQLRNARCQEESNSLATRFLAENLRANGVKIGRENCRFCRENDWSEDCKMVIHSGICRDPDSGARVSFRQIESGSTSPLLISALYHSEPDRQDEEILDAVGEKLAAFACVSHCVS